MSLMRKKGSCGNFFSVEIQIFKKAKIFITPTTMNPIQDSENMDPTRTKKRNASAQSLATTTQKKHQRQGEKHPLSDYAAGSITKIVLSNFMTYSSVSLTPGPDLNVLIGANGTGKSSFVCAIALGLNGKTDLLGRAKELSEFVKRGETKATIEITLKRTSGGGDEVDVVKRTLTKAKGGTKANTGSAWHINGQPSNSAEVDLLVKGKHHVELGNLTNFLPQDKVASFAGLSETDKLSTTETTVNNGELWKLHEELIAKKENIRNDERRLSMLQHSLDQNTRSLQTLSADKEKVEKQQEFQTKAEEYKMKIPWIRFEKKKVEFSKIKEKYAESKEKLRGCLKEKEIAAKPVKELEVLEHKMGKEYSVKKKATMDAQVKERTALTKLRGLGTTYDDKAGLLSSANRKEKDAEKTVNRIKADIKNITQAMSEIPEVADTNLDLLKTLKAKYESVRKDRIPLDTRIDQASMRLRPAEQRVRNLEIRQSDLDSVRGKKLKALTHAHRNAINMTEVDKEVRDLAKRLNKEKKLKGPVLCEIECNNQNNQTFLQKHLGLSMLSSYVIDDDQELLGAINNLFKTKRWHLMCNNQTDTNEHVRGANFKNEYKAYGVSETLDLTFTAPNCVMKTLVALNRVDRAAIADVKVMDAAKYQEMVNSKLGKIGQVYTTKNVFIELRSKYNSKVTFETEEMRPPNFRLFGAQVDREDMEKVKRDLAEARSQVQKLQKDQNDIVEQSNALKRREMEAERAWREEKARLNKPKSDKQRLEAKLRSLQESYKLAKANTNLSATRKQLKKSLATLATQRAQQVQTYVAVLDALFAARKEQDLAELKYTDTKIRLMHYKNIEAQVRDDCDKVADAHDEIAEKKQRSARQCKEAKEEADAEAPLTEELKKKMESMPDDEDELLKEVELWEEKASAVVCNNPTAMQQYKKYEAEKKDLKEKIAALAPTVNGGQEVIKGLKEQWLPQLQKVLGEISVAFHTNCRQVGIHGEVRLREPDDPDEFSQYALDIHVKFREGEPLHALDKNRQSGGERAVATMLYLISLQNLTKCPFRVVDEINQGMDPKNERKVFKQMVDSASEPSTPQCFLLTPKLLNGLEYNDNVTVLCIFNGYRPGAGLHLQSELQPYTP